MDVDPREEGGPASSSSPTRPRYLILGTQDGGGRQSRSLFHSRRGRRTASPMLSPSPLRNFIPIEPGVSALASVHVPRHENIMMKRSSSAPVINEWVGDKETLRWEPRSPGRPILCPPTPFRFAIDRSDPMDVQDSSSSLRSRHSSSRSVSLIFFANSHLQPIVQSSLTFK